MRIRVKEYGLFLVMLLLIGCASSPMTSPQSVKEGMVVVSEQMAGALDTANRLYAQGSISDEQHKAMLREALEVRMALDDTRALLDAGDAESAEEQLGFARQNLIRMRDLLKEHQDE